MRARQDRFGENAEKELGENTGTFLAPNPEKAKKNIKKRAFKKAENPL
jgi:hypothetical protein